MILIGYYEKTLKSTMTQQKELHDAKGDEND